MFCPYCGKEFNGESCPNCGAKLDPGLFEQLSGGLSPAAAASARQNGRPYEPFDCTVSVNNLTDNVTFPAQSGYPMHEPCPDPQNAAFQSLPGSGYGLPQPASDTVQPTEKMLKQQRADYIRRLARKHALSPLFILATLAYSGGIALFLMFFNQLIDNGLLSFLYYDVIDNIRLGQYIASAIPSLIALGLWITLISALFHPNGKMTTAGLTIIKTVMIILMVLVCLVFLATMILLIAKFSELAEFIGSLSPIVLNALGGLTDLQNYIFIGIMVLIVLFILVVLWFCFVLNTLSSAAAAIRLGSPFPRASGFVAAVCFFVAMLLLFGMIALPGILDLGIDFGFVGVSSVIVCIVPQLCFGMLIFLYKGAMKHARS